MKNKSAHSFVIILGLLFLVIGCNNPSSENPETVFNGLEKRLAGAKLVQMNYHITADGAVSADIRGNLEIRHGKILLKGNGLFAGDSINVFLDADNKQVEFGNGKGSKIIASPPELREAILTGLTRMGILHNLARLTGNKLPDHAGGGVNKWVTVDSIATDPKSNSAVSFDIFVSGTPSGSATLEISPAGHPLLRRQTVHFKSGDMRVVEKYYNIKIEE